MNAPAPSGLYKWMVVAMLWGICFFNYADRQSISAIFPLLEAEFGFTKSQLGLIGAAFTWVYALSAPFAGPVGDRFSRKLVILSGLYVWSAVTGFTALCSKVWHFVLVRGAEGLGETFYFPASMSLVSDYHSRATRSRAMSLHQTSVYAGTVGGSAFAGWMGERYGWQWPFVVLGAAGIVLGLLLAAFIREPERNQAERAEGNASEAAPIPYSIFLRDLVRTPTALLLIVAFFGANSVALVFLIWMPTFLKEKFNLNLAAAGLGATFFIQVASMFGAVLGGILADHWSRNQAGGRMLAQAVGAIGGAPFIFLCGSLRDLWLLVGAMTAFGLFKGLYDANIWASLYDVIPPSRRSSAVGLMNMIGWLGGGLGAYLIGRAADAGVTMSAAISSTAVVYLFVAVLLLVAGKICAPRDTLCVHIE
jgi:MFS family permease